MKTAVRTIRRTGNSKHLRLVCIVAQAALIGFVWGLSAHASPPLPETVIKHFEGTYVHSNSMEGQREEYPVAGTIQFDLVEQQAISGYSYLDSVKWSWTAKTLDSLLSFNGQLSNIPYNYRVNTTSLPWRFDVGWSVNGVELVNDDIAHLPWSTGYYLNDYIAGPAWDLITNDNFMPTSLLIELVFANYMTESGQIELNLYDIHSVDIVVNPRTHHGTDGAADTYSGKRIDLSSIGYTRVAVLSTTDFDSSSIDRSSIYFAGATATGCTSRDVDGDDRADLVCYFKNRKLNLSESDTTATLDARTGDSRYPYIQGTGEVRVKK